MPINASITLESGGPSSVNGDRIRLLEAVAREGSISAGARAVGITYKAAWDWLDALANLFGRPMLETRTGGRSGGGATLTPAGARVIVCRSPGHSAAQTPDLPPSLLTTRTSSIRAPGSTALIMS